MATPLHNELRKEFQLERMILFSDAVFAIAITLLVIEIKVPEIHKNVSDKILSRELLHLVPKFIGFLISFFLIGLYWTIHHRMFGLVANYSGKLLWMNLFFLFFIALMPFSTGFYSEYSGPELFTEQLKIPLTFYVLNFSCVGFTNYLMWKYITNPRNKLMDHEPDRKEIKFAIARSLAVPIIFLGMLPVAYFTNVIYAVYMPILIPIVFFIVKKRIRRKLNLHNTK
jgi:uncharacterized membrane protein